MTARDGDSWLVMLFTALCKDVFDRMIWELLIFCCVHITSYSDLFDGWHNSFVEVSVGDSSLPEYILLVLIRWSDLCIYCHRSPVLKHGPRSVTLVQVWEIANSYAKWKCRWNLFHCGVFSLKQRLPAFSFVRGMRKSTIVTTRKMVSYTCARWSQEKFWWKPVTILTCKSFVWRGYRGERPIEPSSSWFPPKFPPG